jgi:hypothetical protein
MTEPAKSYKFSFLRRNAAPSEPEAPGRAKGLDSTPAYAEPLRVRFLVVQTSTTLPFSESAT